MINAKVLLADLTRLLKRLEDDLRERVLSPSSEVPELRTRLQAEWQAARDAGRTAETFESWAEQVITQAGVHWLLSCVFLRFIEDNELVDRPWIGGTPQSGRLALARDRHDAYFHEHPHENDRDYLIACFQEAGALPGLHTFFDEAHNPVFRLGISGDAAMAVMQFWQEVAADSGALIRDFTDPTWNTRFLGDLYQDLSEATRKRYALLQTPEFVEEFILDRTLTPAIQEFGYREVRMIDPTCGSGHFLLGGFHRLVEEWSSNEPGRNRRDIAQRALDAVAGVDLNPFAVAIARFRLLLAALKASDVHRMAEAPDFKIHVAIGDSLLHGTRFGLTATGDMFQSAEHFAETGLAHAYASEDLAEVQRILGRQYHAVVGNPPYIAVSDISLNHAYRSRYASCHGRYSLGCPFTERFFELAVTGDGANRSAGFVGLITTNTFMKREFGIKLIENVLPRFDLTHVIDTANAKLPGHGTPTVIIFGRHRKPLEHAPIRTVAGISADPDTSDGAVYCKVWASILDQVDFVDSQSEFVSVSDISRAVFGKHPWSLNGVVASEVRVAMEGVATKFLKNCADVGIGVVTLEDEAYYLPVSTVRRRRFDCNYIRGFVLGSALREWECDTGGFAVFPHEPETYRPYIDAPFMRWFWPLRADLANRQWFKKSQVQRGLVWFEYGHISREKFAVQWSIIFGEISTHNHFVLERTGKLCNQTAPMIKLPAGSNLEQHLGLLGLLNSSIACFWLKQVCFPKGGDQVGNKGARVRKTLWDERYAFNTTNVAEFPLVENQPVEIAGRLDTQANQLTATQPAALLAAADADSVLPPTRADLDSARAKAAQLRRQMIASQENLDWRCYGLYGLLPTDLDTASFEYLSPIEVALGERAFEIVLARRVAAGQETTAWFERHDSKLTTEIPSSWPAQYRDVVQRRIDVIESNRNIALIERPEFKRRWNSPSWESMEQSALRDWLLDRLESSRFWIGSTDQPPQLNSASRLADAARNDTDFMHIAALYAGHADFDPGQLVAGLVANEAVPFLPVLRYTDTGLRKRVQWEETWALQRREDAGEHVGKIPVPPKYQSKDFLKSDFWRLRGGLDVPKERWISYPGCERGADGSLVIAWAGWDHLQQATALATYFIDMKEREGWSRERLQPLLAGLLELIPWLKQWHNDMNPDFGARMGDYYESFLTDEARALQFTLDDLRAWKPAVTAAKRGRKKSA